MPVMLRFMRRALDPHDLLRRVWRHIPSGVMGIHGYLERTQGRSGALSLRNVREILMPFTERCYHYIKEQRGFLTPEEKWALAALQEKNRERTAEELEKKSTVKR